MRKKKKVTRKYNPYSFILAVFLGMALAVGGSVWATSIGTNVSVSGTLDATGNTTLSADMTVASGASVGTGSTGTHFTVLADDSFLVEGQSEFDGIAWFDDSLRASSTLLVTGAITTYGNVTLGDASGDTLTVTGNSITYSNAGTTTIPSSSAVSWAYATSSANIPLFRFDTSNTRVGISTTTPGATFAVGGAGNIYALGGIGAGVATTTAGALETTGAGLVAGAFNVGGAAAMNGALTVTGATTLNGNLTVGDAAADTLTITSNSVTYSNAGTSTIPSASANAWGYATSTANIPLLKLDTSNTRVGVSTTTPGRSLSVGGDGTLLVTGVGTSTLYLYSTGAKTGADARGSCIEFNSPTGTRLRLYATTSGLAVFETGGCRAD